MTVIELKELIKDLPDNMEVILQKDSERNGFSPLAEADANAVYVADSTYAGEVYSLDWTAAEACMSDKQWAEFNLRPKSLILSPIN